jgi:regulator of sigma D
MAQVLVPQHNPRPQPAVARRISCKPTRGEQLRLWRGQRIALQQELRATLAQTLCQGPEGKVLHELNRLCARLIDYLSTGHASIYCHEPTTCRHQSGHESALPDNIFRLIGDSTDFLLGFTHKYELARADPSPSTLQAELQKLQRSLLLRYTLEEQLLELKGLGIKDRAVRDSTHHRACWLQSS